MSTSALKGLGFYILFAFVNSIKFFTVYFSSSKNYSYSALIQGKLYIFMQGILRKTTWE